MLDFEEELKKFTPSKEAEPEINKEAEKKKADIMNIILELTQKK